MLEIYTSSSTVALWTLFILTFMYFLENFDRYLIAVSPIPYIDYSSYEYSILVGPAFTIIYTVGGLVMALGFYEKKVNTHHPRTQRQQRNDSEIGDERETDGMVSQQEIETNPIPLQQHVGIMKFGKYMVITTATFIFSAAFFCTAIATNFWQQVIIRIVMGLAQSVITPFSTSIIRDHFSPSVSGAAFGIFNVGTYIAFSLSLSLGIYIYLTFGWKAGYLLFGLIGAGSAFMLPLLYFLNRNSVHVQQSEGSREEEDRDMEGDTSHGQQSQLLGNEGESNQSEQVTSGGLPTSPTSSYLSQEAITLSALHQHSISSRGSSPMLSQSASQNSFSASQNHSNMMMGMSTNSSHFINSHQQVHLSGSFAHSILSEVTQGTNTVPSANPFLNTNRNTMSSARSSGMGTQQLAGGSSVSMNSASFLQEIPVDLFQVRLGNSQRNHRESFQGSLSTVDVDSEGNQRHHKNSLLSDVDFDEEEYHHVMIRSSLLQRIRFQLRQIVGRYWWKNPGVIMVCIATGVRIGGGYIWSAYTGPFFSDLFQYDSSQSDCVYSYSDVIQDQSTSMIPTVATVFGANVGDGSGSICDSSFPYCVDGTCAALSENPWHNQGMASINLVTFMSWVPLVGSALGSVVGGFLSDYIVNRKSREDKNAISTEDRDKPEDTVDYFTSNPDAISKQSASRALIAGVSTLISLPIVVFSFFLGFPGCFLIYIASGIVGEVYLSQTLALITDSKIIPKYLVTPSVALFVMVITIIGGNAPLIIPLLKEFVGYDGDVFIDFTASSAYGTGNEGDVAYSVLHKDARNLQYSMMYGLVGCYSVSGILYLVAYFMMVRNSKLR